jgi:hypothetical protein
MGSARSSGGSVVRACGRGGGGDDPDDSDQSDCGEREVRVKLCERDGYEVEDEAGVVFALSDDVFALEATGLFEQAADGETQEEEGEAGDDHRGGVEGDGEGVGVLLEDVGGEEGQKRGGEEEGEVGVEDAMVGLFGAVDEVVVVDPVDADEGEGEEVDEENGGEGEEAGDAVLVRDFELEDHDGDDDGEDSVGEGFEARGGEELFGHLEEEYRVRETQPQRLLLGWVWVEKRVSSTPPS